MVNPLYLASRSPRRKELLQWAHIPFRVYIPQEPELPAPKKLAKGSPARLVKQIAEAKALAALRELTEKGKKEGVILAADTLVFLKDQVLGKPLNAKDAGKLLRKLSGRWHVVCTGVSCLQFSKGKLARKKSFVVKTRVKFFTLEDHQIDWYVKTGEPLDKAGAYGAQGHGMVFIEKFSGSYTNVVGLPLGETQAVLKEFLSVKGK